MSAVRHRVSRRLDRSRDLGARAFATGNHVAFLMEETSTTYKLLGGKVRDKVRVFANVNGESPEARAESARARQVINLRTAAAQADFVKAFKKPEEI